MKLPYTVIAALEARSGFKFRDLHDKELRCLVAQIQEATGCLVGLNTLKRFVGIGTEVTKKPHTATLNILARYLGAEDWPSLLVKLDRSICVFGKLKGEIDAEQMQEGQVIALSFVNERHLELQYLGEEHFKVISSLNSLLQEGDICEISIFVKRHPLFIKRVQRQDQNLGRYTAGLTGGIIELKLRDAQ